MTQPDAATLQADFLAHTQAVSRQIASDLGETRRSARQQIRRIVEVLGPEWALELLAEAQSVLDQGGMSTASGKRQRTPGGIFFALVRRLGAHEEQIKRIFQAHPPRRSTPGEAMAVSAPQRSAPARWDERLTQLDAALAEPGGARTVKVTLTGRPGRIVEKSTYVMLALPAGKLPALPKGLPVPEAGFEPPQILCYVAMKQWRQVAQAIQDPEDILILEGYGVYEPVVQGLAVLTTSITTKRTQKAKRQPLSPTVE